MRSQLLPKLLKLVLEGNVLSVSSLYCKVVCCKSITTWYLLVIDNVEQNGELVFGKL